MRYETQQRLYKLGLDFIEANLYIGSIAIWVLGGIAAVKWIVAQ